MPQDEVFPLRERIPVTSGGATNEEVRTDPVEDGWHWLVTSYGVEDETSALTSIRVYVESGEYAYLLAEQISPPAAMLFHGETRQILGPGDRFGARFNGSTTSDLLRLYVHGWRIPPDTPITVSLLAGLTGAPGVHQSDHLETE